MKAGGLIPGGFALARAVRSFRPDLVHFHSETPEACGAAWLAFRPPAGPVALARTIHNSIFWRYWPRIGRWCDRRLAAAAVNAVSAAAAAEFDRYRRDSGAPALAAPIPTIYNGVDLAPRAPAGAPRTPDLRRVLFAGRFEPQKGTDVLCAALGAVRLPAATRGELVCVGAGAQAGLIDALVRRPPAGWIVRRQPPVSDLSALFSSFDLAVMPSRFEGLGLVAVEATLGGLPVVATDAPGLDEALPPDYPWRAAPDDVPGLAAGLSAALAESDRWAPVVQAAQAFATARFAPARMAADYREFFTRAAAPATGLIARA
jgi:glycosyltransferase involved in cell wall biosynthesis